MIDVPSIFKKIILTLNINEVSDIITSDSDALDQIKEKEMV